MPRPIILNNIDEYRGYPLKPKYRYNKQQLDHIIDALEYYQSLSRDTSNLSNLNSKYMVFDITIQFDKRITVNDHSLACDDGGFQEFNFNDLTKVLDRDYFYYRYTKELSEKYGNHCHLMVIGNHVPIQFLKDVQKNILELHGVRTAFVSPRKTSSKAVEHFHYLNKEPFDQDGLYDCIERMSYRAKVDQKEDLEETKLKYRSFDGTRKLKPLLPCSRMKYNKAVAQNKNLFDQAS